MDYANERTTDFVVEGIDDKGGPSGRFLEVMEVVLWNTEFNTEIGRFKTADEFAKALSNIQHGNFKLIATETVGEPQLGLLGRYVCDEQKSLSA